jgi:hypothetical protein
VISANDLSAAEKGPGPPIGSSRHSSFGETLLRDGLVAPAMHPQISPYEMD